MPEMPRKKKKKIDIHGVWYIFQVKELAAKKSLACSFPEKKINAAARWSYDPKMH